MTDNSTEKPQKIWIVVKSNCYGDFGNWTNLSYHKSEEGAYLAMDKEAKTLNRVDYDYLGTYYYTDNNGTEYYVRDLVLEE